MRIGFVVYGDVGTTSGGFLYDRRLIEGLRARGDDVRVLELPWRSYRRGLCDGVSRRMGNLGTEFNSLGEVDLLVQDELAHPTFCTLNARLRREYDCPIVSVVHHLRCSEAAPWWERTGYRAIEKRYLRGIDAAICNSSFTEKSVTDLAALPTAVAPPAGDRFGGVIDDATIRDRARDGPLEVLFLGSVIARKGLDTLIEALSRLPDERWRLTVVGDRSVAPAYTRRVQRTISRFGVRDRVSMRGSLPDDALEACLRRSHLLAIPSTHEGFGIAYLEGMGFGLPAIATTAGGAREIVTHGETGYLCSPGEVGELARYVRTLANDRTLLADMGVGAHKHYEAHPTWNESTTDVGRFLDRVVAGNPKAGSLGNDNGNGKRGEGVSRALA